jgi:hypothetical protein
MKKIMFMSLMMCFATMASAQEYSIKANDVVTTAGVVKEDKKVVEVEINYGASEQCNMAQFNVAVPEGMAIVGAKLNKEYFPKVYDDEADDDIQPFTASLGKDGDMAVVAITTSLAYFFQGHSGVAVELTYTTDAEMKDGVYDLKITNGVLAIKGAAGGGPDGLESTAKVQIGEGTGIWSPNMWQQAKKSAIYNILGQRIYKANKAGLYIVGNKKYYKK